MSTAVVVLREYELSCNQVIKKLVRENSAKGKNGGLKM
jgi:hypothetical protein